MTQSRPLSGIYSVIGPPGTGKTSWVLTQVGQNVQRGTPTLVCSLTRAAAAEFSKRQIPISPERVGTLHSHAIRALGRPELAETKLKDWNAENPSLRLTPSRGSTQDDPYSDGVGEAPGDALMGEYQLLRNRCVKRDLWPMRVRGFATRWEGWKSDGDLIDFTDAIEIALHDVAFAPHAPHVIIADEAQDHSRLELDLLQAWGRQAGALILVGDPWQALYTWRGADPGIFLDPEIPDDHRRVLSTSYRIPAAVHRVATTWVRELSDWSPIEYAPRTEPGEVHRLDATIRSPEPILAVAQQHIDAGRSVMVAATCSYQLDRLLAVLRKAAMPFANPNRLRRGDWNPLAARRGTSVKDRILALLRPCEDVFGDVFDAATRGNDDHARGWTYDELGQWVDPLRSEGVMQRGAKAQIAEAAKTAADQSVAAADIPAWFHEDQAARVAALLNGELLADEALRWWDACLLASKRDTARYPLTVAMKRGPLTLREQPKLMVGTIHSFKGAEADVVILFPDLSPRATHHYYGPKGELRDAVVRTIYVGLTRARQALYVCDPSCGRSVNFTPFIGAA